jgi:hypothetical protein
MKYLITILLIFFSINLFCQDKNTVYPDYFSIGYFGEKIFHPGITVSIANMALIDNDSLVKRNRLDYGLSLVGYIHSKNHVGLHFKPQLTYYHLFDKSFEVGLKAEMGYMRRFYPGETFEVSDNGEIKKLWLAGQNAFIFGTYISFGQNYWVFKNRQFRWFIEIGAFWEYPYNGYSLMHPSVALGISKRIK